MAEASLFKETDWAGTANSDDVEFVDRCLHVNETSYDIAALWQLLDEAGMHFVRWLESEQWSVERLIDNEELMRAIRKLDEADQYKLIELLFSRPKLELVICKDTNSPRPPLQPEAIDGTFFALNPDVSLLLEKRNLRGSQRLEHLYIYVEGGGDRIIVEKGGSNNVANTAMNILRRKTPSDITLSANFS